MAAGALVAAGAPARRRLLADVLVGAALFVVAAVTFARAVETVPFHGDESEWINAGRYFRYVFLNHDLTSDVWRPSWLNRDQPPLGRYIIGGIVWASGTDPSKVNRSYAWERDYAANLREGRVPEPQILLPVRRAMAIVGAVSVVLLFVAGRLVGGSVAGVAAGLAATASPLIQLYVVQARTESLLALFSTAALVGTLLTARRFQQDGTLMPAGWSVGPVLGLALATKLTAALGIVGVCAYAGAAGLARLRSAPREGARAIAWAVATGLLATVVWVAVNPFLWPDPVGRTVSMLTQQQSIMLEQGEQFGNPVHDGLIGRIGLLIQRTFVENSTPPFDAGRPRGSEPLLRRTFSELPTVLGVSAELVLAALGLLLLLRRAAPSWRGDIRHGPETALLWWLAAYALGIAANLSLDWPRYYVPTAFFGALLIGLGVEAVVGLAARWWPGRSRQSLRRAERPVEAVG